VEMALRRAGPADICTFGGISGPMLRPAADRMVWRISLRFAFDPGPQQLRPKTSTALCMGRRMCLALYSARSGYEIVHRSGGSRTSRAKVANGRLGRVDSDCG